MHHRLISCPTRVQRMLLLIARCALCFLIAQLLDPLLPVPAATYAAPRAWLADQPPTLLGMPSAALFGQSYSYTFTVDGTPDPTVSLASGSLPPGLNLSGAGELAGIPSQAGLFVFTLAAANGIAPDAMLPVTVLVLASAGTPYTGTPLAVPGQIETEAFNLGGEAIAYHDLSLGNKIGTYRDTEDVDIAAITDAGCNGYALSRFAPGEWLKYTIAVSSAGAYDLHARVAAPSAGGTFHVEIDDVDVTGAVEVPNTGDTYAFQTIVLPNITLAAGQHVMRLSADTAGLFTTVIGSFNWFAWVPAGDTLQLPPCPDPAPTSTPTATPTNTPTPTSSPTPTNTPTPTPLAPVAYRDLGNVQIWADDFTTSGDQTIATGNVALGAAGAQYYTISGAASWSSSGVITLLGTLGFSAGAALGSGSFTLDPSSGAVTWGAQTTLELHTIGSSNLAITPQITINVRQPLAQVAATVSVALPENPNFSTAVSYTLASDGAITSAQDSDLTMLLAGGVLAARVHASNAGLVASQAQYILGDINPLTLQDLVIDGQGSTKLHFGTQPDFPLPTLDLGRNTLVLSNVRGTLAASTNAYSIALTGELSINNLPETDGALQPAISNIKIAQGSLTATISDFNTRLAGNQLALQGLLLQRSSGYRITASNASWSIPAAWGSGAIALPKLMIVTAAPFIQFSGGQSFTTTQAFYLGGNPAASSSVRFDQLSGVASYQPAVRSWSVALNTRVTFMIGKNSAQANNARLTVANGVVSGSIANVMLRMAGLDLAVAALAYTNRSFQAAQAQLTLPDTWNSSSVTVSNLLITSDQVSLNDGAPFPIADVQPGAARTLTLTGMQAMFALTKDGDYMMNIATTIALHNVKSVGGGDLTVAGALSIKDGHASGTVATLAFRLSGVDFNASDLAFVDDKLIAAQATLTLTIAGRPTSAAVNGLELGGAEGFRLQGGNVALPDFTIGSVGVQGALITFKPQRAGGYLLSGTAMFAFVKFAVTGSFTIRAASAGGAALQPVTLAFQGDLPALSITLGGSGLAIVRVSGSFNLFDASTTVILDLGAASVLKVGDQALLDLDGSVTLTVAPTFALDARATTRLVGMQVSNAELHFSDRAFSLRGNSTSSLLQASLDLTFGKAADGSLTFYGTVTSNLVVPKGYFCMCGGAALPSRDLQLPAATLEAGPFRKDNATIWGARGQVRALGYDVYAWARFGPGDSAYGLSKQLRDYTPVRAPGLAAAQPAAAASPYLVTIANPAAYLMLIEVLTTTNRLNPPALQVSAPNQLAFTKQLVYEEPDHSARIYRLDFANSGAAAGQWKIVTPAGNRVFVQAAELPPQIGGLNVCVPNGACLAGGPATLIENNQPLNLSWSASASRPGLTLDVYAQSASGTRYPVAHQETSDQATLASSTVWSPALPSGSYTLTLALESAGFAPVKLEKAAVTIRDTTPPDAPADLHARADADRSALASWDGAAAAGDVAGYQVSVDGGAPIAADGRLTQYRTFGLAAGTTHTLAVAAYDSSGNLGQPATVTVTTPLVGLTAWPQRESMASAVTEVGASYTQPITFGTLTLTDAAGAPVAGTVTPLAGETGVNQLVTLGATFTPAGGALKPGVYHALVRAQEPASGQQVMYAWDFTVVLTPRALFLPIASVRQR